MFDPTFSEHSHGFRPGRRAHDAVREAQQYLTEGRHWVVDVDLEKFFDRVNHDVLMGKLQNRISDSRMLRIIRRYLEAGIMANGVVLERHEGTPQGGPLSPLLANVLLDHVDKELERRGHAFVRYADDCNVYVRSRRAAEDVLAVMRRQYAKLRLRINEAKSAVALAWDRKFLGYSFWVAKDETIKRRIADQALEEMKHRVRAHYEPHRWPKPHDGRARTRDIPPRMEGVFPPRAAAGHLRRSGQVDSPPLESSATQTVEARWHDLS